MMRHPIDWLPPGREHVAFGWGLAASLLVGTPLLVAIESGPGTEALVRLVLAGSTARAEVVLAEWSTADRLAIAFANGLDYLFGILAFGTLAFGCAWVATFDGASRPIARALIWLATLAIVLDVPENVSYLLMINGHTASPWPQLLLICAAPRQVIFVLCGAFIARGLFRRNAMRADAR